MNFELPGIIKIRPLDTLNRDDIQRLNIGYVSPAKYIVHKDETPQRTMITLELVQLEQPYIKRWETDEEEYAQLARTVQEGFTLGAFDDRQMVGIAIAEPRRWNRSMWVWEFHVAQEYRRKGIGKRLMDELTERAREAGMRVLVCETQNTNVPAIMFYRSVGYEIHGIDLSYYTNTDFPNGEVAIFMKKKVE
jgi:ribosomal protein S18 acetylase RimI-like enzyme